MVNHQLEEKRNKIISQLPDDEDKKTVTEEAKKFDYTPEQTKQRVAEIKRSHAEFALYREFLFEGKGEQVVNYVCKPLYWFERVDVSDSKHLDDKQKEKVLNTLLTVEDRIAEWKKVLKKVT